MGTQEHPAPLVALEKAVEDNIEKQRLAALAQDSAAQAHHGPDAPTREDGIQTLRLAALVLDPALQARARLNPGFVERYARSYQEGATLPPIKVALVDGAPLVVDGWHRIEARKYLGWGSVDAVVVEATKAEAVLMAMQANLTHGLPLKTRERSQAVRKALGAFIRARKHLKSPGKAWSLRDVAKALGGHVSYSTIRQWLWTDHRKVAEKYWSRDTIPVNVAENSAPRPPAVSPENTCAGSIENALAAFQWVKSDARREELIAMMDNALAKMKTGQKLVVVVEDNTDF